MKLEEAIEILTDLVRDQPTFLPEDRRDAVKLGIEALVRIRYQRQKLTVPHKTLLPGETED